MGLLTQMKGLSFDSLFQTPLQFQQRQCKENLFWHGFIVWNTCHKTPISQHNNTTNDHISEYRKDATRLLVFDWTEPKSIVCLHIMSWWRVGNDFWENTQTRKMPMVCVVYGCSNWSNWKPQGAFIKYQKLLVISARNWLKSSCEPSPAFRRSGVG